jgi:hypothetical protein
VVHTGSYLWMWWAVALLALEPALVNMPIREAAMSSSRVAA